MTLEEEIKAIAYQIEEMSANAQMTPTCACSIATYAEVVRLTKKLKKLQAQLDRQNKR